MIELRPERLIPQNFQNSSLEMTNKDTFTNHLNRINSAPAWLLDLKRASWDKFVSTSMPKHTDDTWRFTNTKNLNLDKKIRLQKIYMSLPLNKTRNL